MIIQYPPLIVIPSIIAHQIGLVRMEAIATLTGMMVITAVDGEKHQGGHDRAVCRPNQNFSGAHKRVQEWLNLKHIEPETEIVIATRKLLIEALEYYKKHKDEL
jgi:hypothetical protein